jgi:hypothetical protein
MYQTKRPADFAGRLLFFSCYLGGDSSFDGAPVGPVVVFGIVLGLPLAPPLSVIPDPPPELMPEAAPVVPDFFMASELVFVIAGLFILSV